MATIELVEQLRRRANVSYADAKEALDACGDDILEALIYLEKQGKVAPPNQGGHYSTQQPYPPPHQQAPPPAADRESVGSLFKRFWNWMRKWFRKGNRNFLAVSQRDKHVISIPITLLAILIVLAFWPVVMFFLIALFFDFRYTFVGPDVDKWKHPPSNKEE